MKFRIISGIYKGGLICIFRNDILDGVQAEAAALLGGKRVIAKLETRIRDLETALDEETRRYRSFAAYSYHDSATSLMIELYITYIA